MTAPEYGVFKVGNTQYPLDGYTTNSLLKDVDKPVYYLLDYFATSLNTYAGTRWTAEMARAKLSTQMPNIVGMKFPNNPFPYLQDTGIKFPLLAIYRTDGKYNEKTISFSRTQTNLEIVWVLPPLTMSQMEIAGPFLEVVEKILFNRSEVPADPNYQSNFNWGEATGFDWIQMTDYTRMMIPHTTTNLPMEAVVMKLAMRERDNFNITGQFETLTGVDTEIDLINNPNDDPPDIKKDFVDLNSDYNPSNFPP